MTKKSIKELRQIAVDISDGRIFTSFQINQYESSSMVGMVFMPLLLMSDKQIKELRKHKRIMFYEYMSAKGPMGINGCPMFMSVRYLFDDELDKVLSFYNKYKKIKSAFIGKQKG